MKEIILERKLALAEINNKRMKSLYYKIRLWILRKEKSTWK